MWRDLYYATCGSQSPADIALAMHSHLKVVPIEEVRGNRQLYILAKQLAVMFENSDVRLTPSDFDLIQQNAMRLGLVRPGLLVP